MKIKTDKKIVEALVSVLEFVRVSASAEPKATTSVLKKIGWHPDIFAKRVNKLVNITVDCANEQELSVPDIIARLRTKSRKLLADEVYEATNKVADEDYDDEEEEEEEDDEE